MSSAKKAEKQIHQNEDELIFDLSDPRLDETERRVLYEIGERFYGVSPRNFEDIPILPLNESIARLDEAKKEMVAGRRFNEGKRRATVILSELLSSSPTYESIDKVISENLVDSYTLIELLQIENKLSASYRASFAASIRHTGNRAKQEAIKGIWASGKYSSRDICAEQECAALGMSFSSARKALRGTPTPT